MDLLLDDDELSQFASAEVATEHVGEVLGVRSVPVEFHSEGKRRSLRIGDLGRAETESVAGQNESEVLVSNPPLAVAPRLSTSL